jgi:hypothetical protein
VTEHKQLFIIISANYYKILLNCLTMATNPLEILDELTVAATRFREGDPANKHLYSLAVDRLLDLMIDGGGIAKTPVTGAENYNPQGDGMGPGKE